MGKIKQIKINNFDGGVTRDLRVQSTNKFKISKNFDNYSDSKRLIPLNALTSAQEDKTYNIVKFLLSNNSIYGLGVVVGGAIAKIYKKTPVDGGGLQAVVGNYRFYYTKAIVSEYSVTY